MNERSSLKIYKFAGSTPQCVNALLIRCFWVAEVLPRAAGEAPRLGLLQHPETSVWQWVRRIEVLPAGATRGGVLCAART